MTTAVTTVVAVYRGADFLGVCVQGWALPPASGAAVDAALKACSPLTDLRAELVECCPGHDGALAMAAALTGRHAGAPIVSLGMAAAPCNGTPPSRARSGRQAASPKPGP